MSAEPVQLVRLDSYLAAPPRNGYSPVESAEWTGVKMLGLGCLTSEGFTPRQLKNAPFNVSEKHAAILHGGDILMSRANTRDLVGLAGKYSPIGAPCIYPDLMMRLRTARNCIPEFLELVLRARPTRQAIQNLAQGTSESMVKISTAAVRSLMIPHFRLEEQRHIVEILDSVSESGRAADAEVVKLKRVREVLAEQLAQHDYTRMEDIIVDGPRNGIYKPESQYAHAGVPIVRINSFMGGPSDLTRGLLRVQVSGSELRRYGISVGDVLINRVNTPGLVGKATAVVGLNEPTVFESNIMRCRVDASKLHPKIVEAWLSGSMARSHFAARTKPAVSQASINRSDVFSCPVPKMNSGEQAEFLDRLAAVDSVISESCARVAKVRILGKGIAADLLGGRVPVGAWA